MLESITPPNLEKLSVFDPFSVGLHILALILGLKVLHNNKILFTQKPTKSCRFIQFNFVDFIYTVLVCSTLANLFFVGKSVSFWYSDALQEYSKVEYMFWMVYHSVAGIVSVGFHICVDKVLSFLKDFKTTEKVS